MSGGFDPIIRQVVLGAGDLEECGGRLRDALGLPQGFADPLLEEIGLADETLRIGREAHLEVVAPLTGEASLARWLAKGGGDGGYALSIQVHDLGAYLERAAGLGVRVVADLEAYGHRIVQLHPGDLGLLVELDEIGDPARWFWDDIPVVPVENPRVEDILGVEVASPDPGSQAAQWGELFGVAVERRDVPSVRLGTRTVRFVEDERRFLSAVDLAAVGDGGGTEVSVGGVTLRLLA